MNFFRRKLYERLLVWKRERRGQTALLIEGARRVGKSTLVRSFAEREYETHIVIDFSIARPEVIELFDQIYDLDAVFLRLQFYFGVKLVPRRSLIVFDEVQMCPRARQAIKHLVADGRYDYVETGSLISIRKNVADIVIPSEEERVQLFPLDYEEFRWALGDTATPELLRSVFDEGKAFGDELNRKLMGDFRLYLLVGGMPQAVAEYLESNNLESVDRVKRGIVQLYEDDFYKMDATGRLSQLFDAIPAQLAGNASRYRINAAVRIRTGSGRAGELMAQLRESMTVNVVYHANDPAVGMSLNMDPGRYKLFVGDTGLFVTLSFKDKEFTENVIYRKLLSDKLQANLGYVYENAVAQMLRARGDRLFYYTFPTESGKHRYEVDFLLSRGSKLCPVEVKSSGYDRHASLDAFCGKFSGRIQKRYVLHTRDVRKIGETQYLPVYMAPFI